MQGLFDNFQSKSISIITKDIKWAGEKEFELTKLRYDFIEKMNLDEDTGKEGINKWLFEIQLNLGDKEETILNRFKASSAILIIAYKEKQQLENELTKIADIYIQDYRARIIGSVIGGGNTSQEDQVTAFYYKLVAIQKELLFGIEVVG